MLLLKPQFIPKQKSIVDNFFETDNILINKNPLFRKQVEQSFIQKQNKKQILKSATEAITFINQFYDHKGRTSLPLMILEVPEQSKDGIVEDIGGFYDHKESVNNSNGIIKMEIDLLSVQNRWKKEPFAIILNKKLGLNYFTKFVLLHEVGHYADFLDRNQLLQSKNGNDILWHNFTNNPDVEKYLRYWTGTNPKINEDLKRNFQENVADCFGCLMLSINSKQNLTKIINIINEARYDATQGKVNNIYSTSNALKRLLVNLQNQSPNHPQDIIDLVQKSAQEGFIMNLKEIFAHSSYHQMSVDIKNDNNLNFAENILNTAKKLKI